MQNIQWKIIEDQFLKKSTTELKDNSNYLVSLEVF